MTCKDCKFWEQRKELTDTGNCHRMPPVSILDKGRILAMWGLSKATDWCGEFQEETVQEAVDEAN